MTSPPDRDSDVEVGKSSPLSGRSGECAEIPESYPFQPQDGDDGYRSPEEARKATSIFLCRVDMSHGDLTENVREQLTEFMRDSALAIRWYERQLVDQHKVTFRYKAATIALLIGIPIVVALLGSVEFGGTTAQITAVLTGLIGTHRTISTWLDNARIVSVWAEAQASLKALLFQLEDKWREYYSAGNRLTGTMAQELRESALTAREVVLAEQKEYYATLAVRTVDLGATLTGASGVAKVMLQDLGGIGLKRQKIREDLAVEAERRSVELGKLTKRVNALRMLVERYESASEAEDPDYLQTLQAQLRETELQRALAQADVDALS